MTRSISSPTTMSDRSVLTAVTVAALAFSAAACGSGNPVAVAPDPDPELCGASWQIIFSPKQPLISLTPPVMRWHDGRLFVARSGIASDAALISFPDTGGAPATIYAGSVSSFWIEGDRILQASAGPPTVVDGIHLAPTLLYSTPLAGGTPDVVVQTHIWDKFVDQLIEGWALDADALYWLRLDGDGWSAWRAGRDGSGDVKLTTFPTTPSFSLYDTSVVLSDRLVAYSAGPFSASTLLSVPKSGGAATPLLVPDGGATVLGVMPDGTVLLQVSTAGGNGQKRSDHYGVQRLRPGAVAVEPFWDDKPPPAYPVAAWEDPGRGSLLSVWEWGSDDAIHTSIWALDGDGRGTRLACDPVVGSRVKVAAVSPEAIFLLVEYAGVGDSYWQVARIPRNP